jgi:hypothetical protein
LSLLKYVKEIYSLYLTNTTFRENIVQTVESCDYACTDRIINQLIKTDCKYSKYFAKLKEINQELLNLIEK